MSEECIIHSALPKDSRPTGWAKARLCHFHGDEVVEHRVCYYCVDRHDLVDQNGSNERVQRPFKVCPASPEFRAALALMAKDGA